MKQSKKWGIVGSVAVVLGLLGWLGFSSFQSSLTYFYTPSEVVKLEIGRASGRERVLRLV